MYKCFSVLCVCIMYVLHYKVCIIKKLLKFRSKNKHLICNVHNQLTHIHTNKNKTLLNGSKQNPKLQ